MNGFQVFSSAMVERPVVTGWTSHSLMRSLIAGVEDTDAANLAFESVYSCPGCSVNG
jgi:hypothetical protein